jgi:agmatine deiminase
MTALTAMRMPAETDRHERTLMAWPTATRREELWRDHLEPARDHYAMIAMTIAAYEPVLLVVDPGDIAGARERIGAVPDVEIIELPIDDSWLRDSGPIFARTPNGERRAVHFRFNAWGGKFEPHDRDAAIGGVLADHLGFPCDAAPFVLEGGAIAIDGTGLLVTTERCLLNPNRNPGLDRTAIEAGLRTFLGAERIVWLADAIAEDDGTDGHVDNVVAFFAPGRALLQGCDDPANPNHAVAADNRARLVAAGIEVIELPYLPYATVDGERWPVPYGNVYACNGAVIVPTTGDARDDEMLALIGDCYPARDVVAVPGSLLAYGGGGVHCITQQVPA